MLAYKKATASLILIVWFSFFCGAISERLGWTNDHTNSDEIALATFITALKTTHNLNKFSCSRSQTEVFPVLDKNLSQEKPHINYFVSHALTFFEIDCPANTPSAFHLSSALRL